MRVLEHGFYDKKPTNIEALQELVVFIYKSKLFPVLFTYYIILYDQILCLERLVYLAFKSKHKNQEYVFEYYGKIF